MSIMIVFVVFLYIFFFKQKTAYEMRISDWSSTCALPILHPAVSGLGGKAARPRPHRRCLHGGRQNPGGCRNATDMGRPELGRSLFSQTSSNSQQPCFGRDQSCKPVAEKAYPRQIAHVLMNGEPEGPLQCEVRPYPP